MRTLRIRLSIWVLSLFVSVQLATGMIFWLYQRAALADMFDGALIRRAEAVAPEVAKVVPEPGQFELDQIIMRAGMHVQFSAFRAALVTPSGQIFRGADLQWPAAALEAARRAQRTGVSSLASLEVDWFRDEGDRNSECRLIAVPLQGQAAGWTLLFARSDRLLREQQRLVLQALLVSGGLGVLATLISAWYLSDVAVQPLRVARRIISQLRVDTLGKNIEVDTAPRELRELARALDESRIKMAYAFEAQERFLSNVSHEIKTPIATLLVESQTLNRENLPKPAVQFVRSVEEEMRKLGKLVESFLTLTRVRDGKGLARADIVPVNELLLDSVSHCSPMARQYLVRLRPELVEDDAHIDASISGDPELLRTMLDNLVRNAIRFSPQNATVTIRNLVEGDHAVFTVTDEGVGMPPAMLKNAFDRFVQAPSEQKQGRGHGLGLTIAQAVAELHGGRIVAENLPECGARFTVRLPLRKA